jgi:hypothetical protein
VAFQAIGLGTDERARDGARRLRACTARLENTRDPLFNLRE